MGKDMAEAIDKVYGGHVLAIPYPAQGHINPLLQFSKRLASKGLKTTLAITNFIFNSNSMKSDTSGSVHIETISDGYDEGGFAQAESIHGYLQKLEAAGSATLAALIEKYNNSSHPIDCVVYDAFLPWALNVAKRYELAGAAFFTQTCAVNYIHYMVHHGLLKLPIEKYPVYITGFPPLELPDMPSFISVDGSYPAYFDMVLHQFVNSDKADWILVNTFYELESEVVESMRKVYPSMLTVGPTIPSLYLDNRVDNDRNYGLNLYTLDSTTYTYTSTWLHSKPPRSVVYMSFGSMACLSQDQMAEIASALTTLDYHFIWVVRSSEEPTIPKDFLLHYSCDDHTKVDKKGLVLRWCSQLEVLYSDAIGCFFTHCGWNSAFEALCMGVPMVGMPLCFDQTTNAKFIQDVWNVGTRVRVCEEDGITVKEEEIVRCVREVMDSERGKEMAQNALKWKELALGAMSHGGSSDKNINSFISSLKMK